MKKHYTIRDNPPKVACGAEKRNNYQIDHVRETKPEFRDKVIAENVTCSLCLRVLKRGRS